MTNILGSGCPERDYALALIVSQVGEPASKASYSSWWQDNSMGVDLGLAGSHTDRAFDWLYERKDAIQTALVAKWRGPPPVVRGRRDDAPAPLGAAGDLQL